MKMLLTNSKNFLLIDTNNILVLRLYKCLSKYDSRRAKLFTFGETMLDRGTGNKTWKEKGVGDMKFLRLVCYIL